MPRFTRIILKVHSFVPVGDIYHPFQPFREFFNFLSKAKAAGRDVLLCPETTFPSGLGDYRLPLMVINGMVAEIDVRQAR